MSISTIIYCAAALAIGIFMGLIVELIADNDYLIKIEKENETLRLKNEQLEQENKSLKEIAKLEIVFEPASMVKNNYFKPF